MRLSGTRRNHSAYASGFSLVELLTVVAIIGILAGLLLPAVQQAREAARKSQCLSNLRQIALAFHQYHDNTGMLPHATSFGTTFLSAFTAVLPHIEEADRYRQYDRSTSYRSPRNLAVIEQSIPLYKCPSMALPRTVPEPNAGCDERGAAGSYAVSSGTKWPWTGPHDGAIIFAPVGAASVNSIDVTRFRSISDGLSRTLLIGEFDYGLQNYVWGSCKNRAVRWGMNRWGVGYPGVSVGSTIGHFNSDRLLNSFEELVTYRSDHPGGAQFALADGSARFVSDSIDAHLLDALATRAGGEVHTELY